jgi:cell division transport system permease protein
VFAARAALQAHRDVVDVLHMTGARAGFIARQVQWRFFRLGGEAALLGLVVAVLFAVLIWNLAGIGEALPALAPVWNDAIWFLAVPAAAALLAMLTARAAVARFLSRAP